MCNLISPIPTPLYICCYSRRAAIVPVAVKTLDFINEGARNAPELRYLDTDY